MASPWEVHNHLLVKSPKLERTIPGLLIFKCLSKLGDEVLAIPRAWAMIADEGAEEGDHFSLSQ